MDVHFPSCYDPSKELTDYENNMAFPTINYLTGKQNCPDGWTHVPHLFYEMYWNTPEYADRWTPNQGSQPFVLANGDLSGCSAHGDFLAAWDTDILQHVIDTCNAGDLGMDQCSGITVRDKTTSCNVASPIDEEITGNLTALPGDNPLEGWGMTYGTTGSDDDDDDDTTTTAAKTKTTYSAPAEETTTTTYPSYPVAEDTTTSSTALATAATTTAVTTLPNGKVIYTTVVEWITVTTIEYETTYKTIYVDEKRDNGHEHAHNHMLRHRSPHRERK